MRVCNYLSAGLPVVTTPVANLDDVMDLVHVAGDVAAFTAAIELALQRWQARRRPVRQRLQSLSWQSRVEQIPALLDTVEAGGLARRPGTSPGFLAIIAGGSQRNRPVNRRSHPDAFPGASGRALCYGDHKQGAKGDR